MVYSLLYFEEFYICTIGKRDLSFISTPIPIIVFIAILVLTSLGIVSYLIKKRQNKSCLPAERFSHYALFNGSNWNIACCEICKSIYNHTTSFPKEDIELSKNITNSESNIIILSKLFTKSWDFNPDFIQICEEKLKTRINFCACGGDHCIDKPVESADCDSDFHLPETDNFEESQDKSIQYIINNSEIRSEHNRNHITKEVNQRGVPQNKHLKNCERYQGKEKL